MSRLLIKLLHQGAQVVGAVGGVFAPLVDIEGVDGRVESLDYPPAPRRHECLLLATRFSKPTMRGLFNSRLRALFVEASRHSLHVREPRRVQILSAGLLSIFWTTLIKSDSLLDGQAVGTWLFWALSLLVLLDKKIVLQTTGMHRIEAVLIEATPT
ncbi:hypothetical protein CDD81_1197 [Ophiocordyceps australis]|uniref:Uncharacterized protein n=1 Tax=Ophiocordyceps australis TaxID=1399860 RepID=A0A2C5XKN4_9HYPO|nr:hypothetical protein CDD81_1197 [Ophiocordyceps australis]